MKKLNAKKKKMKRFIIEILKSCLCRGRKNPQLKNRGQKNPERQIRALTRQLFDIEIQNSRTPVQR